MTDATIDRWVADATAACRELADEGLDGIAPAARAAVTRWRWARAGSAPHRPEPWWAERETGAGDGWCEEEPAPGSDAERIGFDADDRPLLVERHRGGEVQVVEVWEHASDRSVVRHLHQVHESERPTVSMVDTLNEPKIVVMAEHGFFWNDETPEVTGAIERWTWNDGIAVRGEVTSIGADGERFEPAVLLPVFDDHGAPLALLNDGFRVWLAPVTLRPDDELHKVLMDGLTAALAAGVAASGVDGVFVLDVRGGGYDLEEDEEGQEDDWVPRAFHADDHRLPGFARLGGAELREAMVKRPVKDVDALQTLLMDAEGRGAADFMLAEFCDAETLAACRELNHAMAVRGGDDDLVWARAVELVHRLADDLAVRLNAPAALSGVTEDVGVLVSSLSGVSDDGIDRARRVLGAAWFEDFSSRVTSGDAAPVETSIPPEAYTERAALTKALGARGITEAERIVREHAAYGLRLRPAEAAAGSSEPGTRLHGRGVLPPGVDWPQGENGRALAFLAAIDLSELPVTPDGPLPLPDAGWMLFFADLDDWPADHEETGAWPDEGSFYGEETPNEPGALAQMLWVPPGQAPLVVEPPPLRAVAYTLPEVRCSAVPQLLLPTGHDADEVLGLQPVEVDAYFDFAHELAAGPPDAPVVGDPLDTGDWVLGLVTGVQGESPDPSTVLLLHLGSVFEFQDGGAIQFRIPGAALATGDWSQVVASADSH